MLPSSKLSLSLTAAAALAAAPALAAPAAGDLLAWLAQNTDLRPAQVAIVEPDNVYSLEPLGAPSPTGEVIALVRTEARAPGWSATHGFQSWDANLLVDCRGGRLRVIRSASYRQQNRRGPPVSGAPDADWTSPHPGEPSAKLLAAACDPAFAWPLRPLLAASGAALSKPGGPKISAEPEGKPPEVVEIYETRAVAPAADAKPSADGKAAAAAATPATTTQTVTLPASAPNSAVKPAPGRPYFLQITRGPSETGARKAMEAARRTLGAAADGLTVSIDTSDISGKRRYTARLAGFPSAEAAEQACASLIKARQTCYVRPMDEGAPRRGRAGEAAQPASNLAARGAK
ncbi:MAG TPA: SPOR domain-containing protein [Phenylobacterium sp.]|uniref:SPOR domain-containing protein n=1 Tax=Phenylobacterium sp. TaxID=1871053 RepID=UPI002C3B5076|nr:SPOR domain-containing protein [Phenylobacterium sp.]HSV03390.1 SPOR domain-containing protein [Phenylobacterium sp.]